MVLEKPFAGVLSSDDLFPGFLRYRPRADRVLVRTEMKKWRSLLASEYIAIFGGQLGTSPIQFQLVERVLDETATGFCGRASGCTVSHFEMWAFTVTVNLLRASAHNRKTTVTPGPGSGQTLTAERIAV